MYKVLYSTLTCLLCTTMLLAQDSPPSVSEVNGRMAGETITDFQATDQHGNVFQLREALKMGPAVVMFYRGQWCPVCKKHLSNLQDSLEVLQQKGATVVAISPEKQEFLAKTVEKTNAEFTLLFDENYIISRMFDVIHLPSKKDRMMYNTMLDAKLKKAHSDDQELLPVPATFVIGQDGVVKWRHFDRDYKNRATAREILMQL
jgi:peroxiredoxin